MAQADFRGARGSNVGDDFHELWALRQALATMEPHSGLVAVGLEGLNAEDEQGTPLDTWDGVDCTLYYEGNDVSSAKRIIIDQVKYSAANPYQAWTVARLTYAKNKGGTNSIIRKLATAFAALRFKRPDLASSRNLIVRLVSNQPIDQNVQDALSDKSHIKRATLQTASGLGDAEFDAFSQALDLSECGSESRFAVEARVLKTIAEWTDDDARASVTNLLRFVRRSMMPEARREIITRESILVHMGFSDPAALFPCPSALKPVDQLISRIASKSVAERMTSGTQRICLHGVGGCGKTTAIQEIEALLPAGSVAIVFDCYGGGRYLDSDAYRHRRRDGFLQLSNELASQLRLPMLVNPSTELDYPKVFKRRLEKAAEVVASRSQEALLVIAIDAADNSVIAADGRSPPETSFVHDFFRLGDLPANVHFLVTGRTGRLPLINLPHSFEKIEIKGFSPEETALHVQAAWSNAPANWLADFHALSGGNPRVQRYALNYASAEPERALDYLRPSGKNLEQVFREQFKFTLQKGGDDRDVRMFCAGLIALQRPVPITDLSAVTGLAEAHLHDLCSDLAPGVRLTNLSIGFADEDFEDFVRTEAQQCIPQVRASMADHLLSRHKADPYAATHVATALFATGRGREVLDLISAEREPTAIADPVLRREAQLQRLQIAMKVCRETGNNTDAMMTLLIGAEALKTDAAIRQMLIENPDLAACFARDTSGRMILRDAREIENHGPLLFHLMAADARKGNAISVREGGRQLRAWLGRRSQAMDEQRIEHPGHQVRGWSIENRDIAAETEAVLRIAGPQRAIDHLLRWRPRSVALHVAITLSTRLLQAGEVSLVERCLSEAGIPEPWSLFLQVPLALAGKEVDLIRLETALVRLFRRKFIRVDKLRDAWSKNEVTVDYLDMIMSACEVIISRGGDHSRITPVLETFADRQMRRRDQLYTSRVTFIDLSLRAHTLLERLAGREPTLESYWIDPPEPSGELPAKKLDELKKADSKKKEELKTFIGPLLKVYDVRALALAGLIPLGEFESKLGSAIAGYNGENYRLRMDPSAYPMRMRTALSIARLMVNRVLDRTILLTQANSLIDSRIDFYGTGEMEVFSCFALDPALHPRIVQIEMDRASNVRSAKIAAEEKLAALVRLARLLVPFNLAEAESLFNAAIEVAGEVNADAIHELALFAPLADRAVAHMGFNERRAAARDLAIVSADAGVRLTGHDYFPWDKIAQALTTLDISLALAATSRWMDEDVVGQHRLLPSVLQAGLSHKQLFPAQVIALSSLLNEFEIDLIAQIVQAARNQSSASRRALADEIARDELLRFGDGKRPEVTKHLASLTGNDGSTFWLAKLVSATDFHQTEKRSKEVSEKTPKELQILRAHGKGEHSDPFGSIDWTAHRFVTIDEILEVTHGVLDAAKSSDSYVPVSTILDRVRSVVRPEDRVGHLEALSSCKSENIDGYELARAITQCIDNWLAASLSVRNWCRDRLLHVVIDFLPGFSRWLPNDQSFLPKLLGKSGNSDTRVCASLIEGMERHVDALNAPTIYALVGLIGQYCAAENAAQVVARYAERLLQRISSQEQDVWSLTDLPTSASAGVARLLFAFMGDVDVRLRWRAAHALRRLARLGESSTVDEVMGLYDRTSESSYREPQAPFYWLAARLWLMVGLDRIADEAPSVLKQHGLRLLEIASEVKFPHLLVRSFAKSALNRLVASGVVTLDPAGHELLKRANTSPIPRRKGRKPYSVGFRPYTDSHEGRRFHFDSMDTLPYWYDKPVEAFADVSGDEFLDAAERWIVDQWGVQGDIWRWDSQPRLQRFSGEYHLWDHRHGSMPTLERFNTYLEWHAMWCATGELMKTRALAIVEENDDYHSFEAWIERAGLAMPPGWLADLRASKPLEDRLWFPPDSVDAWVENVSEVDFLAELVLVSDSIVVASHHNTRSSKFSSLARIETALVSRDTARALVRALQTIEESHAYRIPPAGHDLEINVPPYRLLGWLDDIDHDSGIDAKDPLRYEIRAVECRPSKKTVEALNIEFVSGTPPRWVANSDRETRFSYEAWGDIRGDEPHDWIRYDESVRSSGWRLRIVKEALTEFLNKVGLDLIVEIEITRRNKGYDDYRDEEKTKEATFDRVILLRGDGTIETAEGRIGAWAAPGS